jgi:hypothetical protein
LNTGEPVAGTFPWQVQRDLYENSFEPDYVMKIVKKWKTVGFGYRTAGIATTPIVQAPTFVCGLVFYTFSQNVLKKFTFSPFHLSMLLTNETIDAWFSGHIQNHIKIHQFILHAARHTKGRLDPNCIHQRLLLFLLLILLLQIALRLFHPQNQGRLLDCYPLGCHRTIVAAD